MASIMKRLTATLLDVNVDEMSDNINDYKDELIELIDQFNKVVKDDKVTKQNEAYKFVAEKEGTLIAPVTMPCYNVTDKLDYVYMGLNPMYSADGIKEKKAAFEHDGGYFDFYNSKAIYEYLMNGQKNNYYQKVIKVAYAILGNEQYDKISISNIRKDLRDDHKNIAKEDHKLFYKLFKNKSFAFPEMIPFHSSKTDYTWDDVNRLKKEIKSYECYLNELFNYISNAISDHGIVISNGSAPTKMIKEYIEIDTLKGEAVLIYKDSAMDIYLWKNAHWVLMRVQIGSQGSEFNGDERLKQLGDLVNEVRYSDDPSKIVPNSYIKTIKEELSPKHKKQPTKPQMVKANKSKLKNVSEKALVSEAIDALTEELIKQKIDQVIKDVVQNRSDVALKGKTFYLTAFADEKVVIKGKTYCKVTYERYIKNNQVKLKLTLYKPNDVLGNQLIEKADKSEFKFKMSKGVGSDSRKMHGLDIYTIDPALTLDEIGEAFRRSFTSYLNQDNKEIIDIFTS